jgi:hypothetical protein
MMDTVRSVNRNLVAFGALGEQSGQELGRMVKVDGLVLVVRGGGENFTRMAFLGYLAHLQPSAFAEPMHAAHSAH